MINRDELQGAISECLSVKNPNANTCIKLAAYYTIMDHLDQKPVEEYNSNTEFGSLLAGIDNIIAWKIIDDLMTDLQAVCPRLYDDVIRKMKGRE